MTCIVSPSKFPTKKALKEACEQLNKAIVSDEIAEDFFIEDPSIVKPRSFNALSIKEGQEEVVTNHPKRSWFAQIGRKGGKLYVK